ncbi:hypothetical protein [Terrimonas ginsenosidimutans]|nr:hypothetical protein [Terrimonas ginsenosidimutans]
MSRMEKFGMKGLHRSYPDLTDEQVSLIYQYIILADFKANQQ